MLLSVLDKLLPFASDFYFLDDGNSDSKFAKNIEGVMGGLFRTTYHVAAVSFVLALLFAILSLMMSTTFGGNKMEGKEKLKDVFVGIAIVCVAVTLVSLAMGIGAGMK